VVLCGGYMIWKWCCMKRCSRLSQDSRVKSREAERLAEWFAGSAAPKSYRHDIRFPFEKASGRAAASTVQSIQDDHETVSPAIGRHLIEQLGLSIMRTKALIGSGIPYRSPKESLPSPATLHRRPETKAPQRSRSRTIR